MNIETFWNIIDKANVESDQKDQEAMLKSVESQLSRLPAKEIVEWFNIHHLYLDLADRKDVERAASNCGIYLSDDSFLYFRGWLLSLGKDAFYTILNTPDSLSEYVTSPADARFEGFVYAGHDVYTQKAFAEEYGPEGMQQWRDNWFAENPNKGDYACEWALESKYSLWDASAQNPLSDEQKEVIRKDLFSRSAGNEITVEKTDTESRAVEKVLLDMLPPESKEYRKLSISLYSGYGFNMLPAGLEDFHQEMKDLFLAAGWDRHEPKYANTCPEYSKGKSRLYCHPTEISGPCEASLIPEVCRQIGRATKCTVMKAEDRGRVFDITPEQYMEALKVLRTAIEKDLLREFSLSDRRSDDDRHENVMLKYRVMTLENHTDMLSSLHPYWKYTGEVLNDLIAQKKIVERSDAASFRSQNYVTAPEYQAKDTIGIDAKIKSASTRATTSRSISHLPKDGPEPDI